LVVVVVEVVLWVVVPATHRRRRFGPGLCLLLRLGCRCGREQGRANVEVNGHKVA
jgi:hypothetical protein